tara:strand:+ start:271 stop:1575 length:1305 start_codon:yes stop_codon:yes gene_type:complete
MITDLNKILVEWAYRTSDGQPDVKSNAKLLTLESVLKDFGWSREARAELLSALMTEDDIVKNRKTGNVYTVKNVNKDKHRLVKKNASKDDIKKIDKAKEKGDEKPTDSDKKEPSKKQIKNEKEKKEFLKTTVNLLVQELKQTKKGAGAREMDKEQWLALKNFAEGKGPEIKQYEVSEQDIDDAINLIKKSGKKGVMSFLQTKGAADPDSIRKGTEDNPGPGWNRDRKMIKSFLACGGLSAVTGKPLSIGTSNVDHRLSLENGGKDEPENWIWMETEMNMNKSSLTDEQLIERAKKALAVTDDEKRKKQLINIIKNESKKFVTEHYKTLFELGGNGGITEDELKGMTIPEIKAVVYGWNKVYPKTSDLYINYYAGQKAGSRGAGGRGVPLPKGKLINNVIEQLNKKERVLTSEEIEALDGQLQEGIEDIKREAGK